MFKSLFSNVSVDQEVSSDKEFVVLSVLCKEETQEGSLGGRVVGREEREEGGATAHQAS